MSTETTQATPETSTPAPQTPSAGSAPQVPATPAEPVTPAPAANALDFLPESYRQNPAFNKYKSQDEFYKGVENLQKLVGQKQVVNGLQVPGEAATEEEVSNFYKALGVPETADKYELPADIALYEGADIESEKKAFSELAHKIKIPPKQAAELFKAYAERMNTTFGQSQAKVQVQFDQALVSAFGNDFQSHLGLAKRGAKALGNADKLNLEDLRDPIALKALAKLGEYVGEDTFVEGDSLETKESLIAEARRIQASDEYKRGDKILYEQVQAMYKKAYPN